MGIIGLPDRSPFPYLPDLKPSDFAIINTDNPDDFAVEDVLLLPDSQDRKLKLRVNYVCVESRFALHSDP